MTERKLIEAFIEMIEAPLKQRIAELEVEVARLNKWADGFSDAQLKERRTGEAYQSELRDELNSRWYPIETAPKDGTQILLATKTHIADGIWNSCWAWPYLKIDPLYWRPLILPKPAKPTEEKC